jgi:serine-type D-Ala-D-Ala carboxypeptidase/endopeptidase (penicillin-binding protein 4)
MRLYKRHSSLRRRLAMTALVACAALGTPAEAGAFAPDNPGRGTPPSALPASERAHSSISSSALQSGLSSRMNQAGGSSGAWVYDATAKRVLFSRRSGSRRSLASNMKLYTTATAIDAFGAGERLRTRVWAVGTLADAQGMEIPLSELGSAEGGGLTLDGDLYLVGDGDPTFGRGEVRALARQVDELGIETVTGKLYGDDFMFDRRRGVPDSGYRISGYIGTLSSLVYASQRFASNPPRVATRKLKVALRKRGVKVGRGIALRRLPQRTDDRARLAFVSSPTMRELIQRTNVPSNNFLAEMLLKRVGAQDGHQGTTRSGAKRVKRFARSLGARVRAKDGSGLTRGNRASPASTGHLLLGMLKHREKRAYLNSLAVAGRSGTLAGRMRGTAAQGRCRGKTGTISGVSALSGYCDAHGHRIVFSFLMNGVNVSSARGLQDGMTVLIARYGG